MRPKLEILLEAFKKICDLEGGTPQGRVSLRLVVIVVAAALAVGALSRVIIEVQCGTFHLSIEALSRNFTWAIPVAVLANLFLVAYMDRGTGGN